MSRGAGARASTKAENSRSNPSAASSLGKVTSRMRSSVLALGTRSGSRRYFWNFRRRDWEQKVSRARRAARAGSGPRLKVMRLPMRATMRTEKRSAETRRDHWEEVESEGRGSERQEASSSSSSSLAMPRKERKERKERWDRDVLGWMGRSPRWRRGYSTRRTVIVVASLSWNQRCFFLSKLGSGTFLMRKRTGDLPAMRGRGRRTKTLDSLDRVDFLLEFSKLELSSRSERVSSERLWSDSMSLQSLRLKLSKICLRFLSLAAHSFPTSVAMSFLCMANILAVRL
mmetsp:Transcript_4634/g.9047  ORF Transcript_4634/g.9047 Transcript_4634/m.9047 type:complete len:286 (+) Transcript_4634:2711-3568(+)